MELIKTNKAKLPGHPKERIGQFRSASKADETKRALSKNWNRFINWCQGKNLNPFPCSIETMESYLVFLADEGLKASSIDQAKWAIDSFHKLNGQTPPGIHENIKVLLAGIKRTIGSRQIRKEAFTIEHIRKLIFRNDLIGIRDKALLLLGFAGGFRRSELSGILIENIRFTDFGLVVHLDFSKTDQVGTGAYVEIVKANDSDYCPVLSVKNLIEKTGKHNGPLFYSVNRWNQPGNKLSTVTIGKLVKFYAAQCGLDPDKYGGHSLRSGCATFLLDKGVSLNIVSKQGRWKRADTVLRYDRNQTSRALEGIY